MNLRRHKYKKGRMAALILVGLSLMGMPVEAWAATKPISSVNVSVTSKLEAGSRLPDIQIGRRHHGKGKRVQVFGDCRGMGGERVGCGADRRRTPDESDADADKRKRVLFFGQL